MLEQRQRNRRWILRTAMVVAVASVALTGCLKPGVVYRAGVSPGYGPGLWRTAGGIGCEYTRLRSLTGDGQQDTITHDFSIDGPRYVQIDASDAAFYQVRCLPWWRQDPPGPYARTMATPGQSIPGFGDFLVGLEVAPGTYTSAGTVGTVPTPFGVRQPVSCTWKRVRGFHGSAFPDPYHDTILAGGSDGVQVLTIQPDDFGLSTTGCQPWTRIG